MQGGKNTLMKVEPKLLPWHKAPKLNVRHLLTTVLLPKNKTHLRIARAPFTHDILLLLLTLRHFCSCFASCRYFNILPQLAFTQLFLQAFLSVVLHCVRKLCAVSILNMWWDKINTANRILLPPSCFHRAAVCILPPPFVPLPSSEGVAETISLY